MNQIVTYLTFNGNCREAMEFYQGCLGGELNVQTVGQTPGPYDFPEGIKNFVVHAALKKDNMVLMGTDLKDEELLRGNSVSILLNCDCERQINEYYKNLQTEGEATHPLEVTHWGDLFGGLTDKYGNHWLFHCRK